MRNLLQWGPVALVAVLGLGWLTKYESDKNRSQVFLPPTMPAQRTPTPTPTPAPLPLDTPEARRIQALTSCTDLLAAYDDAVDRADRLRDAGETDAAWSARSYVRLADSRLQKLRCDG